MPHRNVHPTSSAALGALDVEDGEFSSASSVPGFVLAVPSWDSLVSQGCLQRPSLDEAAHGALKPLMLLKHSSTARTRRGVLAQAVERALT